MLVCRTILRGIRRDDILARSFTVCSICSWVNGACRVFETVMHVEGLICDNPREQTQRLHARSTCSQTYAVFPSLWIYITIVVVFQLARVIMDQCAVTLIDWNAKFKLLSSRFSDIAAIPYLPTKPDSWAGVGNLVSFCIVVLRCHRDKFILIQTRVHIKNQKGQTRVAATSCDELPHKSALAWESYSEFWSFAIEIYALCTAVRLSLADGAGLEQNEPWEYELASVVWLEENGHALILLLHVCNLTIYCFAIHGCKALWSPTFSINKYLSFFIWTDKISGAKITVRAAVNIDLVRCSLVKVLSCASILIVRWNDSDGTDGGLLGKLEPDCL